MEKKEVKPRGYWTYERCKEEAKKYVTKTEYRRACPTAYSVSLKNKWLEDFDFVELEKPRGYWHNYERCKEEASKYSRRVDFSRGCHSAYKVAWENDWLKDFGFEDSVKPKGYWDDYDVCYAAASECETRSEFQSKYSVAYTNALKNDWFNAYYWIKKTTHKDDDYWIYAYEDEENKVVYVGLTFREKRHKEHKKHKKDTARLYFESINKPLPEPRVKMDGLNAEDAQYYEDWYKEKYAEAGWKVLNRAKTGVGSGSLGSGVIKWDYERCKEEALKYKTKREFEIGCASAYKVASKNKWLNDFGLKEGKKHNGFWDYEHCKEESKKYDRRVDFERGCPSAYQVARKNGWLDEFLPKAA